MKTGTLKELNVKPGDVVEWIGSEQCNKMTVISAVQVAHGDYVGEIEAEFDVYGTGIFGNEKFRIISRADDTPTLWRDMTPEEKGKLLLAHHEGKVIEFWANSIDAWTPHHPTFSDRFAYRIKPEPKVVTVDLMADFKVIGTIDLIDGKPDPASIKMEEL